MFGWVSKKKRMKKLEEDTRNSFSEVKKDMDVVGNWIKHLDTQDKQLFNIVFSLKRDLSSIRNEIEGLREAINLLSDEEENKQVFKKLPVLDKQTGVLGVQKSVQTAVQTDNFFDILKSLSSNERLIVFTLLNNDMKLSYEDLALLLGKEKSTIRGQINAIKQKSESLIKEVSEKTGKKRVFIPDEVKEKLSKYAKVRVKKKKKEEKEKENA